MLDWLQQHHLSLPAWVMAESMRPFAWLAGQAALVAAPVASVIGLTQWENWTDVLNDPERYDALCEALAERIHARSNTES